MATTETRKRKTIGWVGLLLSVLYGWIAWMTWSDISTNLYQYDNPDAVTARDWIALVVPAISAVITLLFSLRTFRIWQPWQGWTIAIIFVVNLILQVVLFAMYFGSWGGSSFG
jgi:hypothetical protein